MRFTERPSVNAADHSCAVLLHGPCHTLSMHVNILQGLLIIYQPSHGRQVVTSRRCPTILYLLGNHDHKVTYPTLRVLPSPYTRNSVVCGRLQQHSAPAISTIRGGEGWRKQWFVCTRTALLLSVEEHGAACLPRHTNDETKIPRSLLNMNVTFPH